MTRSTFSATPVTAILLRAVLFVLPLMAVSYVPSPVAAKAEVERSVPDAGAVVDETPANVAVQFTEAVDPEGTWLVVIGPDGARVDLGDNVIDPNDDEGRRVTVSMRAGLAPGDYTVHWNSVSTVDDDGSFGHFVFALSPQGATCPAESSGTPGALPAASPPPVFCAGGPPEGPFDEPLRANGVTVALETDKAEAGPIDITVRLEDDAGAPVTDAQVTVRARHLEMDHGEFPKLLSGDGTGRYVAENVGMGMGGKWRIAVDVIRPGQDPTTVFFLIDLAGLS